MSEKKLKRWVQKKLEDGVERDKIKQLLEEADHDPSIVDDVEDPFDGEEEIEDHEVDLFKEEGEPEEDKSSETEEEQLSVPDTSTLPRKKIVIAVSAVLVILAASTGLYSFLQEEKPTGCINQGITIKDITTENGKTVAEAQVVRNRSQVVLEIHQDGELLKKAYGTFIDTENITVNAVGDKAVLKAVGCERKIWERDY